MPSITIFSNLEDKDARQEDTLFANYLNKFFDVNLVHPFHYSGSKIDLALIRNVWPTAPFQQEFTEFYERLKNNGTKIYNHPSGKGDMRGKQYLVDLSIANTPPVIPSVSSAKDIEKLGKTDWYFLKPIHGGSSIGAKKVSRPQITKENMSGYIYQPFLDIQYESSHYFIDKKLQYSLKTRSSRWDLVPYEPTTEELSTAQSFAEWNALRYGIQRIDLCKTETGKVFLIEIEDWCPYLSLTELNPEIQNKFLETLMKSLDSI
jgi:hypothetical protein